MRVVSPETVFFVLPAAFEGASAVVSVAGFEDALVSVFDFFRDDDAAFLAVAFGRAAFSLFPRTEAFGGDFFLGAVALSKSFFLDAVFSLDGAEGDFDLLDLLEADKGTVLSITGGIGEGPLRGCFACVFAPAFGGIP